MTIDWVEAGSSVIRQPVVVVVAEYAGMAEFQADSSFKLLGVVVAQVTSSF